MGSKSHNQNNLQHRPSQTIQTIAYQGLLPPPDMMERFKALDPNLPERIVRMAEMSLEKSFKELDIYKQDLEIHRETTLLGLENEKTDLDTRRHEAETRRLTVNEEANYNFRAQMIILAMVVSVLISSILLGVLGHSNIAYVVAGGGFATIIIAAIKGVSNKSK